MNRLCRLCNFVKNKTYQPYYKISQSLIKLNNNQFYKYDYFNNTNKKYIYYMENFNERLKKIGIY